MSIFLDIAEIISQTGEKVTYSHDLDGRLTSILDPALQRSISYDAGNRITSILDSKAGFTGSYQHDQLDRLLKQTLGQNQTQTNLSYVYDANSNRTQKNTNGTIENTPIETTSNKLTNVTYDANGSITNDGTRTYTYNSENRLKTLSKDNVTANYIYNALNQRVKKQVGSDITYFSYDEQGKLIGEYDKDNKLIREFIYLGNQPIGLFTAEKPQELLQIHTDHLGTPRAVTNKDKEVLWRLEGDQFGDVAPQIAQIKMPLRHAGQYYDSESGLFYNWHRYYDPKNGRYITSDPIGLNGGLNTFGYVGGSPLAYIDPMGLYADSVTTTCARNPKFCTELGLNTAGAAAAMSISRPSNMSKLEERAYDRYCNNDDDPCKALQVQTDKAIADAKTKMKDLLRDKDSLYGKQGWTNHTNNLKGRIAAIEAMISLGEKMGCNMFKQKMAAKRLGIPDAPKPWWRIF